MPIANESLIHLSSAFLLSTAENQPPSKLKVPKDNSCEQCSAQGRLKTSPSSDKQFSQKPNPHSCCLQSPITPGWFFSSFPKRTTSSDAQSTILLGMNSRSKWTPLLWVVSTLATTLNSYSHPLCLSRFLTILCKLKLPHLEFPS